MIRKLGIFLLILSFAFGGLFFVEGDTRLISFIKEFYANISAELLSISITILIIDYLYDIKEKQANKKRLLTELSSVDIGFSSRALKELRENGWVEDGSLSGIDLSRANLRKLDLSKANLKGTNLSKADLTLANLNGACLDGAILNEVTLLSADLKDATLVQAQLRNSNIRNANLNGTNFENADMIDSDLQGAEARNACFKGAKLEESRLGEADFSHSDFEFAQMLRVDIYRLNVKKASFRRSDFEGIIGWESLINVTSADFSGTKNLPTKFHDWFEELKNNEEEVQS